ncbi:MAG: hypothetical protein KAR23_05875 [Candidatus Aenigmarchaeota archaeon]|nr:hypothetical protein [Candidatus Aenigmarchaeota archaeon]
MYPSSIFLAEKYNEDGSLDDQMLFGDDFKAMIKRVRSDIKNGIPLIETKINGKTYTNKSYRMQTHYKFFFIINHEELKCCELIELGEYKEIYGKKDIRIYNEDILFKLFYN